MASTPVGQGYCSSSEADLPPGVWREVLLHLSPLERFVASMVCTAWRSHALSMLTPHLEVCLNSGAAATGFGRWLAAHGHKLNSLSITEYFFAHHGHYGPAAAAAGQQGIVRSRLGPIARVALWQGLHAGGRPMLQLHTLKVRLDDISAADAVALGLCVMPALTHLTLESNASAIGVTGAAGLVTLTTLQELVLPTQALGDQGLQFIGANLTNLGALNVHNDGHVTDDGLGALAGLTALTYLDLQGNVSITQSAMPVLAAAAKRLRALNLSWLAMVNDWGLGQLISLVHLEDLNLRATGVQLETAQAVAALCCFTALTRLDLSRCKVGASGLAAVATSLVSLQDLSLAESNGMTSFTELQPLQQLSSLTKLDLSSPGGPSMRQPGKDLTAICQLTQLRHLALNNVMSRSWMNEWLWPSAQSATAAAEAEAEPDLPLPHEPLLQIMHHDLCAAAAPVAARLMRGLLPAATTAGAAAAGDADEADGADPEAPADAAVPVVSSSDLSPWGQVVISLGQLTCLTALEFAGNATGWVLAPRMFYFDTVQMFMKPDVAEPAALLLSTAGQHGCLQTLSFKVHRFDAPAGQNAGSEAGMAAVDGLRGPKLVAVAATMLSAVAGYLGFEYGVGASPSPVAAEQSCSHEQQLSHMLSRIRFHPNAAGLQWHGEEASAATAAAAGAPRPGVGAVQAVGGPDDQLQQQQQGQGEAVQMQSPTLHTLQALWGRLRAAAAEELQRMLREHSSLQVPLLSQEDAVEVIRCLCPGLHSLQFD